MECLITNEICSSTNKKCKVCKFDTCKEVMNMLEMEESFMNERKMERLKENIPEQCKNCSFLEVIDLDKQVVKCFYKINERCILK